MTRCIRIAALIRASSALIFVPLLFTPAIASATANPSYNIDPIGAFPSKQSLMPQGYEYSDTIPNTYDPALQGIGYIKGALATHVTYPHGEVGPTGQGMLNPATVHFFFPNGGADLKDYLDKRCFGDEPPCLDPGAANWGKESLGIALSRIMSGFDASDGSGTLSGQLKSERDMLDWDVNLKLSADNSPLIVDKPFGIAPASAAMESLMAQYEITPNNAALKKAIDEFVRMHKDELQTEVVDGTTYYFVMNHNYSGGETGEAEAGYYSTYVDNMFQNGRAASAMFHWYILSGNQEAFDIGTKLSDFLRNYKHGLFWQKPIPSDPRFDDWGEGAFAGHIHSFLWTGLALLEEAEARLKTNPNDALAISNITRVRGMLEFVERRTGGDVIGNFGEIGTSAEMIRIANKLDDLAPYVPQLNIYYYDQVERWARNELVEAQITQADTAYIADNNTGHDRLDRVGTRSIGMFFSDASHALSIPLITFWFNPDGPANAIRGVYDVWAHAIAIKGSVAKINFLFNRTHQYFDVKSDLPYRGRIEIDTKTSLGPIQTIAVRRPGWMTDTAAIHVYKKNAAGALEAMSQGNGWSLIEGNRYISISNPTVNTMYVVTFPMKAYEMPFTEIRSMNQWWYEGSHRSLGPMPVTNYIGTFLGYDLVNVDHRPSGGAQRFQRSALAALVTKSGSTLTVSEVAPPPRYTGRFALNGSAWAPLPQPAPPTLSVTLSINGQSTHAISNGEEYTFKYVTTNVSSCRMTYQGTGPHASQSGAFDLGQSQLNVSGEANSGLIGSYTLTCRGTNGQSASATLTITEISAVSSVSLTINGQQTHTIHNGDSYIIKYATSHVISCHGTYQGTGPHASQSGTFDVTPNTSGEGGSGLVGSYTLTCRGDNGQDLSRAVTITEIPNPASVPAISLSINGQQTYAVSLGAGYTIRYSSRNVRSCTLSYTGVGPHAAYHGSQGVPANVSGQGGSSLIGSYTLSCVGNDDKSISSTVTITEIPQNTSDVQVSLTANGQPDVTIPENSDFTIKYSSANAASCSITYQVGSSPQQTSDMPPNTSGKSGGHITSGSATYTFTCTGTNGSSASQTAKISTSPNVQASLTINGGQSITLPPHTGFTLVYSSANAASCSIRWQVGSGAIQTGDIPANTDGQSAGEVGTESITYTMTCGGVNGSTASKKVEIIAGSVLGASTATPIILEIKAGASTASGADTLQNSVQGIQTPTAPAIARFTVSGSKTQNAAAPKIANLAGTEARAGTPAASISTSACLALSRNLSVGSRGADVTRLQKYLIARGLLAADSATGFYGRLSQTAVQKWQAKTSIISSGTPGTTGFGVVGPKTRAALNRCN